jgi:hypothetical protein
MGRAEDLFDRVKSGGIQAIQTLTAERQSEELLLDFKRSNQNDRNTLAKAISAFGNSGGGLIIWGVNCSKASDGADVADRLVPLQDAKRFKSWLEGVVSGCTFPPHGGVQHVALETGRDREGVVATYIPQSNDAPHQVVGSSLYYMRAGSAFAPVPHQILAGMFGRRPQPDIVGQWLSSPGEVVGNVVQCQVGYTLRNEGAGIARDMFLDVKVWSGGEPSCEIAFKVLDEANWNGQFALGRFWNLIAKPDYRMAPGAIAHPLMMILSFAPPFSKDIKIERTQGCKGAPLSKFIVEIPANRMEEVYDEFMDLHRNGTLTASHREILAGRFFGHEFSD